MVLSRLALVLVVGLVATGCAGADGRRAQELLAQAEAAETRLTSASYELELSVSAEGQNVKLMMDGGAYLKGKRAGDQVLSLRAGGLLGGMDFQFVSLGGQAHVRMDGRWQRLPASLSARGAAAQGFGSGAFLELARYVKDVRVEEGKLVNGEPTASVAGTIDTAGLVKAVMRLNGFSKLTGGAAPDLGELVEHLGDTHAVLAISERTHLVRAAVVDLTIEQDGKKVVVQLVYRLRSANQPVRIPKPL